MHAVSNMCSLWKCCIGCYRNKGDAQDSEITETKGEVAVPLMKTCSQTKSNVFQALYSFKPGLPQDLELQVGDKIQLEDIANTLYEVWGIGVNLRTMQKGLVPLNFLANYSSLEANEWFFGNVSLFAAETMLTNGSNENGIFLIRSRPNMKSPYALSVTMKSSTEQPTIKHYLIHYEFQRYYISKEATSLCLETLISSYMRDNTNSLNLCTQLIKPFKKSEPVLTELSGVYTHTWEINLNEVTIDGEPEDSGNSGEVYKGHWRNKIIAVKRIRSNLANIDEIISEVKQMKALKHRNIISCFGICSTKKPYLILMEYMDRGSLLSFIKENKLNVINKLYIASQIADGMTYLEKKNVVHRDIAARNILINSKLIAKIADFGLSRYLEDKNIYTSRSETKLPLIWLAPESYKELHFSSKSDVWSFGILLMELFTEGKHPYEGVEIGRSAILLFNQILSGYRMPKPDDMHDEIYQIISSCWEAVPDERPSFFELSETMYRQQERFE